MFAHSRKQPIDGLVTLAGDQELFGGEPRDDFGSRFPHDHLLLDSGRLPTVRRRPIGLESKDHPFLDDLTRFSPNKSADDWFLPNREANPMPEL